MTFLELMKLKEKYETGRGDGDKDLHADGKPESLVIYNRNYR